MSSDTATAAAAGTNGEPLLESAMETGQGADDEPEMAIGDKLAGEPVPDPNGDGRLTMAEAGELLGLPADTNDRSAANAAAHDDEEKPK